MEGSWARVYVTGDVTPDYLDRVEMARHAAMSASQEERQTSQMNLQFSVAAD